MSGAGRRVLFSTGAVPLGACRWEPNLNHGGHEVTDPSPTGNAGAHKSKVPACRMDKRPAGGVVAWLPVDGALQLRL